MLVGTFELYFLNSVQSNNFQQFKTSLNKLLQEQNAFKINFLQLAKLNRDRYSSYKVVVQKLGVGELFGMESLKTSNRIYKYNCRCSSSNGRLVYIEYDDYLRAVGQAKKIEENKLIAINSVTIFKRAKIVNENDDNDISEPSLSNHSRFKTIKIKR